MNEPIKKYIKTECGITEYHRLKALSQKNIFYKIRAVAINSNYFFHTQISIANYQKLDD